MSEERETEWKEDMEDECACEDGFLPVVGLICCRGGYRRLSEDRLRGGSCGLGFSFGFVGGLDMVKHWLITWILVAL